MDFKIDEPEASAGEKPGGNPAKCPEFAIIFLDQPGKGCGGWLKNKETETGESGEKEEKSP